MKRNSQLEDIMVDVAQGLLSEQGLADVLFALHTASN